MQTIRCDKCSNVISTTSSYRNEHLEREFKDEGKPHYDILHGLCKNKVLIHYMAYEEPAYFKDQWPGHLTCYVEKELSGRKELFKGYKTICEECYKEINKDANKSTTT